MGESEEVGSRILFLLENENLCFFSGIWMVVGKCNSKSVMSFLVFGWQCGSESGKVNHKVDRKIILK